MYIETFAKKLKKARMDLNYTQRDIEAELGIRQATLASYEIGRTQPDIETLGTLADFYGVSTDWLIGTIRPTSCSRLCPTLILLEYIYASTTSPDCTILLNM